MTTVSANTFEMLFPHRICINLDRRSDRWANCQREFERHGISVRRQSARDGLTMEIPSEWRFGACAYGCAASHVEAVREAHAQGCKSLLIFEDDFELHAGFRELFERFAAELPARWDAILFGGIHREDPIPVSPHLARIVSSYSTFAYALNHTIFDAWLEQNGQFAGPTDEVNKTLQQQFAFYCSVPPLAWVAQDYSDILGAEVNHWWVREGFAIDGSLSREMALQTGVLVVPPRGRPSPAAEIVECLLRLMRWIFPKVACCTEHCAGERSLRTAELILGAEWTYWIIAESDLYVDTWELKASLLKVRDHDLVAPLHAPLPLVPEDTARVLNGDLGPVDTRPYPRVPAAPGFPGFAILRTAARHRLRASEEVRVFHSPSRVFLLSL
jgi:hypothetical protein